MQLTSLTFLAGLTTAVLAAPTSSTDPTATVDKRAACTFTGTTGAAAAKASKASCSTITLSGLTVPAGQTLDLTGLKTGTKVIFEGTTKWGHSNWAGPLISVSGSGITVSGASGHVLDGQGALWWDGLGDSGVTKPKFFAAHDLTGNSLIENINILNPPHQVFSINSAKDLTLNKVTIDGRAGDTKGGHNTDCFDIGSSDGVTITGATCYNQDDCVAINSGTNIIFSGGLCSGGHGLSIGSVGGRSDNVVKDVTFKSSTVQKSQNGVRVKTISGATGSVSGVTFESITCLQRQCQLAHHGGAHHRPHAQRRDWHHSQWRRCEH
ncbi:glycosyl hydrolases family 28-domain-containing protein [Coniella lustricola]|uniref:endo-polygalacturonase n=1 Tax=Coniella lustricola TaxID=2025994 RepID=A0A2T2ZZ90_9PEZI|nr:glycosyl hydrolases family 28-domain-containing protein [Coniella lustricola]